MTFKRISPLRRCSSCRFERVGHRKCVSFGGDGGASDAKFPPPQIIYCLGTLLRQQIGTTERGYIINFFLLLIFYFPFR